VPWKFIDFRVTIPGNQLVISGNCAPEVKFPEKILIFSFLNSYKRFKTEYGKTPNSGHFANFNLNFRWFAIFFCTKQ